jgi:hypothetical protein
VGDRQPVRVPVPGLRLPFVGARHARGEDPRQEATVAASGAPSAAEEEEEVAAVMAEARARLQEP